MLGFGAGFLLCVVSGLFELWTCLGYVAICFDWL